MKSTSKEYSTIAKESGTGFSSCASIEDSAVIASKWSAVQRVRFTAKVGLPLGSSGCGAPDTGLDSRPLEQFGSLK